MWRGRSKRSGCSFQRCFVPCSAHEKNTFGDRKKGQHVEMCGRVDNHEIRRLAEMLKERPRTCGMPVYFPAGGGLRLTDNDHRGHFVIGYGAAERRASAQNLGQAA